MTKPAGPPSKIGNKVTFSPPISAKGSPKRIGQIKDEIWSEVYPNSDWGGWNIYTSQLIEWASGGRSIRLTYYYFPAGGSHWIFGGQYSLEDSPAVVREIITRTLETNWR
jgi:hypothetical protein